MALKKEIELKNGVIVNYHRIVSINKITNSSNIIEVASYTNKEKRLEEKEFYKSTEENKQMDIFIDTTYIEKEYNADETIEEIYNYLKNTEKFKGAEDII